MLDMCPLVYVRKTHLSDKVLICDVPVVPFGTEETSVEPLESENKINKSRGVLSTNKSYRLCVSVSNLPKQTHCWACIPLLLISSLTYKQTHKYSCAVCCSDLKLLGYESFNSPLIQNKN